MLDSTAYARATGVGPFCRLRQRLVARAFGVDVTAVTVLLEPRLLVFGAVRRVCPHVGIGVVRVEQFLEYRSARSPSLSATADLPAVFH